MKAKTKLLSFAITCIYANFNAYASNYQDHNNFYHDLQDLHKLIKIQDIDYSSPIGYIKPYNYIQDYLTPWDNESVSKAISDYEHIKKSIEDMILYIFQEQKFTLSGAPISQQYIDHILTKLNEAEISSTFDPHSRGIITSEADALFVPCEEAIVLNQNKTDTIASNQKNSSSLIRKNTPVYILGQLNLETNLNPAEDSWVIIWKPEMGIKFVKSTHVALVEEDSYNLVKYLLKQGLSLTSTSRLQSQDIYTETSQNRNTYTVKSTNIPRLSNFFINKDTDKPGHTYFEFESNKTKISNIHIEYPNKLELYLGKLEQVNLATIDHNQRISHHIKTLSPVSRLIQSGEYINSIYNSIFTKPEYSIPRINKLWAWGAGTIGINKLRGQDSSLFMSDTFIPLGLSLPRFSKDQVNLGYSTNPVYNEDIIDTNETYNVLINQCKLGNIASYGVGNMMVCLGNLTVSQLKIESEQAYQDAISEGMRDQDQIPLIAMSALSMKKNNSNLNTGRTAIYPLFKSNINSLLNQNKTLKIFSFFSQKTNQDPVNDSVHKDLENNQNQNSGSIHENLENTENSPNQENTLKKNQSIDIQDKLNLPDVEEVKPLDQKDSTINATSVKDFSNQEIKKETNNEQKPIKKQEL